MFGFFKKCAFCFPTGEELKKKKAYINIWDMRWPKPGAERKAAMKDPNKKEKKEQEWADRLPDDEESADYEPTYRDGSTVNECWNRDQENA